MMLRQWRNKRVQTRDVFDLIHLKINEEEGKVEHILQTSNLNNDGSVDNKAIHQNRESKQWNHEIRGGGQILLSVMVYYI